MLHLNFTYDRNTTICYSSNSRTDKTLCLGGKQNNKPLGSMKKPIDIHRRYKNLPKLTLKQTIMLSVITYITANQLRLISCNLKLTLAEKELAADKAVKQHIKSVKSIKRK